MNINKMKTSEKFLQKYTDRYSSFEGTHITGRINVENAEVYGRIRELEVLIETLKKLGIDNFVEVNELNEIKEDYEL